MAWLSLRPILCQKNDSDWACLTPEKPARLGLTNVALTIIGKGEAHQSDAFRSDACVADNAQSSDLA